MNKIGEGYLKGDTCYREGCQGIIDEHEKEGGCSCHISPPCGYCERFNAFCPVCDWSAQDEQYEYDKKQLEIYNKNRSYYDDQAKKFSESRDLFYKKYRGEIEPDEFEYRKESHTYFSMKVLGVHPKGFDLSTIMDKIRGTFGGRFTRETDTTFEYIAYTD